MLDPNGEESSEEGPLSVVGALQGTGAVWRWQCALKRKTRTASGRRRDSTVFSPLFTVRRRNTSFQCPIVSNLQRRHMTVITVISGLEALLCMSSTKAPTQPAAPVFYFVPQQALILPTITTNKALALSL